MTTAISSHRRSSLEPGATFAGYEIEEVVDRGGAGQVYVARRLASGRPTELAPWLPVALKVFEPDPERPPWSPLLLDTARLQAQLDHPAVASVYEFDTSPAPYLSMTLVRGPTLADLLARGAVDDRAALELARHVAGALDAAREHGLVYRDLRPTRVLLAGGDPRGARLGDFGAARPADVEADVPSNVRALASILFECFTSRGPGSGSPGLRELRPDLPAELEHVLADALDDDPRRRPGSAGELVRAVQGAYPTPVGHGRRAPSQRRATAPLASRLASRPAGPVALLLVCATIAGAILGAVLGSSPSDPVPRPKVLVADALTVRHPADWTRARTVPEIPGLALRDAAALAPPGPGATAASGRAIVLGRLEPTSPALLADALATPSSAPPSREAVELGALQGYRYEAVRPAGSERQTVVYLLPTSGDAVVVACLAPPGSAVFMADCERVASTLRLTGASPVALATSPAYARALRGVVSRLEASRRAERRRLRGARTPARQAASADRLSRAYRSAQRSVEGLVLPGAPELHTAIVGALGSAGESYARMATAARDRRRAAWTSARARALASERELQRRLRELRTLG